MKRLIAATTFIALLAIFAACPKQDTRKAQGEMDTPEHHVTMAQRAIIDNDDWDLGYREYKKALELNPNYGPALIGQAVVLAHKKDFDQAKVLFDKSWDVLKGDPKKELVYYTGAIQYYSFVKGDDWMDKAEKAFEKGQKIEADNELLLYTMACVYMYAYEFSKAETLFSKVVGQNAKLSHQADVKWKKVQDIVRARPGTQAGKKIALVEKITKADVAALFVEEMHLPELWAKRGIKTWEAPAFQTPEAAAAAKKDRSWEATDVSDHPLKLDINACLRLGIRGLEVGPNGEFDPNKAITRAEYAVMLEDILIKVLNEPGLGSKYVGESDSKFHDMRTDHWAYNGAVVVTSRQLMPMGMEGKFKPMEPVSGSDALLVIRKMMDYLKIG